ncbi:hypothetical protein [Deinococcus roseus]|uniref:Uncharacterized protein n=1 Tax=Deinococcus roseus TaxID=392414 RepID=A0ABQ2D335_9DEIO|nr:hypothetical protein [Deinococcus roseus]GGJ44192.1 hypothetical protein GCM10008938_33070 [Deinococcus roseus]
MPTDKKSTTKTDTPQRAKPGRPRSLTRTTPNNKKPQPYPSVLTHKQCLRLEEAEIWKDMSLQARAVAQSQLVQIMPEEQYIQALHATYPELVANNPTTLNRKDKSKIRKHVREQLGLNDDDLKAHVISLLPETERKLLYKYGERPTSEETGEEMGRAVDFNSNNSYQVQTRLPENFKENNLHLFEIPKRQKKGTAKPADEDRHPIRQRIESYLEDQGIILTTFELHVLSKTHHWDTLTPLQQAQLQLQAPRPLDPEVLATTLTDLLHRPVSQEDVLFHRLQLLEDLGGKQTREQFLESLPQAVQYLILDRLIKKLYQDSVDKGNKAHPPHRTKVDVDPDLAAEIQKQLK